MFEITKNICIKCDKEITNDIYLEFFHHKHPKYSHIDVMTNRSIHSFEYIINEKFIVTDHSSIQTDYEYNGLYFSCTNGKIYESFSNIIYSCKECNIEYFISPYNDFHFSFYYHDNQITAFPLRSKIELSMNNGQYKDIEFDFEKYEDINMISELIDNYFLLD